MMPARALLPLVGNRWLLASSLAAASIWLFSLYRATTLAVIHDEAFTYQHFVDCPWAETFERYDANNHVLNSVLCKISVGVLGLSELSLRLPSLLGSLLFLATLVRLARFLFEDHPASLALVLVIGLNPVVLDFLSMARGYSLGLGFLTYAFLHTAHYLSPPADARPRHLWRAGAAIGLSISSNLTMLFPSVAAICAAIALPAFHDSAVPSTRQTTSFRAGVARRSLELTLPAFLISASFLALPLSHASKANFYVGEPTLAQSISNLVLVSLVHWFDAPGLLGTARGRAAFSAYCLPFATSAILVALCLAVPRLRGAAVTRQPSPSSVAFFAATLLTTIAELVLAHLLTGVPYPTDRTGLYLITIFAICWVLSGVFLSAYRLLGWCFTLPSVLFVGLLIVQSVSQLDTTKYLSWAYDAATRSVMEKVRERGPQHRGTPTRISATWIHAPALEFYRRRFGLWYVEPIVYELPTRMTGFDYYVLNRGDRDEAKKEGFRILFRDPAAGIVLATRPDAPDAARVEKDRVVPAAADQVQK